MYLKLGPDRRLELRSGVQRRRVPLAPDVEGEKESAEIEDGGLPVCVGRPIAVPAQPRRGLV
jgi:hypothetical protein